MRRIADSLLELNDFKSNLQNFTADMGVAPSDSLSGNLAAISNEFNFMTQLTDELIQFVGGASYDISWSNLEITSVLLNYDADLGFVELGFYLAIVSGPYYTPVIASDPENLSINLVNIEDENQTYSVTGVQNYEWGGFGVFFSELIPVGNYIVQFMPGDLCLLEDINNTSPDYINNSVSIIPWFQPFPEITFHYDEFSNTTDIRVTRENFYWEFVDELDPQNIEYVEFGPTSWEWVGKTILSTANLVNGVQVTVQGEVPGPLDNYLIIQIAESKVRIFGTNFINLEPLGFITSVSEGGV